MKKPVLKCGDKVICIEGENKNVIGIVVNNHNDEIWVRPENGGKATEDFWGPRDWFSKLPKKEAAR